MSYIDHLKLSIENATNHISKIPDNSDILKLDGMSSTKVRHLLNNVCAYEDSRYLEIGAWKGSTLISALCHNSHARATCIENFSEFKGPRQEFMLNTNSRVESGIIPRFDFIESDCFKVDLNKLDKKNIYFFDGGHTLDDHIKAFTYYNDILDDEFICIVDDWNHKYDNVRKGTEEAFKQLYYNVLYSQVLPARFNGDKDMWWNGIYAAVVKKP
jgi:hypothetical protein